MKPRFFRSGERQGTIEARISRSPDKPQPDVAPPTTPRSQSPLRVIEVDPTREPRWENFVANHPDGLIYHHPAWLRALENEYGRRPLGLACEDSAGQLQGVLALLRTRGLPLGLGGVLTLQRLSSLPRTPVSGPLTVDIEATAALVRAAVQRTVADPGSQLQLKVSSQSLDGLVDGLVAAPWRLSYVLDLSGKPEQLGLGRGRARRRNMWAVNKARRMGVRVRQAETEDDLRAWYWLYLDTMRYLAVPPRSFRFFAGLWEILRPRGFMNLLLAEQEGGGRRLLAGSIFLTFGHTVCYAFTGWRRGDHSLRANDLVHWHAIKDARGQGFQHYDFGEVASGQEGLAGFKAKWGGEPRQLYRYLYPAPNRFDAGPFESGRLRGLPTAVWRRVPLRATALIGDWLYGYL